MSKLGEMKMPAGFRYKSVHEKGRPHHSGHDDFLRRHPAMDCGRRAKLFSPFDALRGFDAAILTEEARHLREVEQTVSRESLRPGTFSEQPDQNDR